jgi:hypothetical protein
MVKDDNGDEYKITLAQQIFGVEALFGRNRAEPGMSDVSEAEIPLIIERNSQVSEELSPAAANLKPVERMAQQRQRRTDAELAEMIEFELSHYPDCPKQGFGVTVYGGSYWRAMLTIAPAAGGIRDPQRWRNLTDDIAERLRKGYDLAWE